MLALTKASKAAKAAKLAQEARKIKRIDRGIGFLGSFGTMAMVLKWLKKHELKWVWLLSPVWLMALALVIGYSVIFGSVKLIIKLGNR